MVQSTITLILQRTPKRSLGSSKSSTRLHRTNISTSLINGNVRLVKHCIPTSTCIVSAAAHRNYHLQTTSTRPIVVSEAPFTTKTCKINNNNNCSNHQKTFTRNKVFVSKHNQSLNVTSNQITEYCANQGIAQDDLRTTNTHVILRECPFCSKPTRGKADNMFKIYVQIGGGAYYCHRCGAKGRFYLSY